MCNRMCTSGLPGGMHSLPALLVKEPTFGERGAMMAALRLASRALPPLVGWLATCLAAAALCLTFSCESFKWVWYNLEHFHNVETCFYCPQMFLS